MSSYSESRDGLFSKFVDYRTACGLWNEGYGLNLLYFDRYCTEHFPGTDGLTQEMLNGWCAQRETENKSSMVGRTLPARKLAEYLNERGLAELDIPEMPQLPPKQYIPHAFTDGELARFFSECDRRAASAKTPDRKLRSMELSVMFRLLYSSGIRTTEARLLRVADVDLGHGVLNIRKSKNSIEHYVALHDTTTQMLASYDRAASRHVPDRELFFPGKGSKPITACTLTWEFHRIWDAVNDEKAVPYDLRHNYAIQNINSWLSAGFDFNDKLLYLSKSMGHTSLDSTRYYYSIVPALAGIIEEKSGAGFNDVIPEVPDYEE
ncbi:MAG: tyrosine-type recombinase/integrase [Muribaculaceae bacterium]|nr:tyrosine-type recombinase/integrase [Muribaculaceae bacterium]